MGEPDTEVERESRRVGLPEKVSKKSSEAVKEALCEGCELPLAVAPLLALLQPVEVAVDDTKAEEDEVLVADTHTVGVVEAEGRGDTEVVVVADAVLHPVAEEDGVNVALSVIVGVEV